MMMSRMNTKPFSCTYPHTVSLRRRYESKFLEARAQDVFTFCTRTVMPENAESHSGSHARVHLRFAFQTFEGMEGS